MTAIKPDSHAVSAFIRRNEEFRHARVLHGVVDATTRAPNTGLAGQGFIQSPPLPVDIRKFDFDNPRLTPPTPKLQRSEDPEDLPLPGSRARHDTGAEISVRTLRPQPAQSPETSGAGTEHPLTWLEDRNSQERADQGAKEQSSAEKGDEIAAPKGFVRGTRTQGGFDIVMAQRSDRQSDEKSQKLLVKAAPAVQLSTTEPQSDYDHGKKFASGRVGGELHDGVQVKRWVDTLRPEMKDTPSDKYNIPRTGEGAPPLLPPGLSPMSAYQQLQASTEVDEFPPPPPPDEEAISEDGGSPLSPRSPRIDARKPEGRRPDQHSIPWVSGQEPVGNADSKFTSQLLQHPDQGRFYSQSEWEIIDDWVALTQFTALCPYRGDPTALYTVGGIYGPQGTGGNGGFGHSMNRRKKQGELWFCAGTVDGNVLVFDCTLLAKGKRISIIRSFERLHSGPIRCLSAANGVVTSGGDDGVVRRSDISSGRILVSYYVEGGVTCFDQSQNLLAIGTTKGGVSTFIQGRHKEPFANMWHLKGEVLAVSIQARTGEVIAADRSTVIVSVVTAPGVCQILAQITEPMFRHVRVARQRCVIFIVTLDGWMFRLARASQSDSFKSTKILQLTEKSANVKQRLPANVYEHPADTIDVFHTSVGGGIYGESYGFSAAHTGMASSTGRINDTTTAGVGDMNDVEENLDTMDFDPNDDEGCRLATLQDDGLLRIWSYAGLPPPSSSHSPSSSSAFLGPIERNQPPCTSEFQHVRDLHPINKSNVLSISSINEMIVIDDRFVVVRAGIQLVVFHTGGSKLYKNREDYTQQAIKQFMRSPPRTPVAAKSPSKKNVRQKEALSPVSQYHHLNDSAPTHRYPASHIPAEAPPPGLFGGDNSSRRVPKRGPVKY